ncbi:MAG TPA: SDR family oxidoreductase, partial [Gallionella sp.]|nr:SDR family oxidoreductase [Gallionella sp.]
RAALPWLKDAGGSSVINVSSTFGHKPTAMLSHYAASKAALEHLTRCWALELAADGIRVNAVSSGPVNTDFMANQMHLPQEQIEIIQAQEQKNIPLGRRGNPEEVAEWIVSLALPSSAWITGQVVSVDGGLSVT